MATVHERLNSLESNLAQRIETVIKLVSPSVAKENRQLPSLDQHWSLTVSRSSADLIDRIDENAQYDELQDADEAGKRGVVVTDGFVERFYAETSTYSYFTQARAMVGRLLEQNENNGSAPTEFQDRLSLKEVSRLFETYVMPSYHPEDMFVDDNAPLELPPRELLEGSLEFYLKKPGIEPPLFESATISAAVHQQYNAKTADLDESWILCFNSIALQAMGWIAKDVRSGRPAFSGMDDDTFSSLLMNINRGFARIEKFRALRMVNVQALLLLVC